MAPEDTAGRILVFALAGVGVVLLVGTALFLTLQNRRRASALLGRSEAAELLARLDEALDLGEREGTRISGQLQDDRQATVTIEASATPTAVLTVELRKAPRMRLTRESAATRLKKAVSRKPEVQVGDREFDDTIFIETGDDDATRHHLARGPALRAKILEAFATFGIESIEVKTGFVEARAPLAALRRVKDYPRLLDLLAALARAFDSVGIKVKVLGGERIALAGLEGNARCAYCHVDVTGEEPDLVACEKCGTVLHAGCYDELGQCPILGCPGRTPERAQARETG